MQLIIRVDASPSLGNGHMSRCLTLAKAWRARGGNCCFIISPILGNGAAHLTAAGFRVLFLPSNDLTPEEDAQASLNCAASYLGADAQRVWWLVDVYRLDKRWHSRVRRPERKLWVIDDLANRDYDADILLDQTPGRDAAAYRGRINSDCQLLLGAAFAILREDFLAQREQAQWRAKGPRRAAKARVFIAMGGTDPHHDAAKILQHLLPKTELWESITLVTAENAAHLPALKKLCAAAGVNLRINVTQMAALLNEQDIAIGAAGVSALERASLGLPSLNFVTADNQLLLAENLSLAGCAINLGVVCELSLQAMSQHLQYLFHNSSAYHRMSKAGLSLCDGLGVERIFTVLQTCAIQVQQPSEIQPLIKHPSVATPPKQQEAR